MPSGFTLDIEKMVYGGAGLGRIGGKVVFVPFTAPGDRVEAEVRREKKDFIEATLRKIIHPSIWRTEPFCPLFGRCGGCQYQHIRYADQIRFKEDIIREFLNRRIKEKNFEWFSMIPSPHERGYRIRAQFKVGLFKGKEGIGFYAPESHRVVPLENCPMLHPLAGELLGAAQRWRNQGRGTCRLKGIDIQVSPHEGKGIIALRVEGDCPPEAVERLRKESPLIKGIVIEGDSSGTWGDASLCYQTLPTAGEIPLGIQADYHSFTQVNPCQNENLIQTLMEWTALTGREGILDLYCGSGNLSLSLARRALRLWGIDLEGKAIGKARENAERNGLSNAVFWPATAQDGVKRILKEAGSVEVAVLDPPRAGAGNIIAGLVSLRPRKVFYVSCEPPTLVRDLAQMESLGYHLLRIQPLDMFPQTSQIEIIAELRNGA
jgi:23S rRNA (uracil1939-C5)-methyltransferase